MNLQAYLTSKSIKTVVLISLVISISVLVFWQPLLLLGAAFTVLVITINLMMIRFVGRQLMKVYQPYTRQDETPTIGPSWTNFKSRQE